jgi:hypothetical protein
MALVKTDSTIIEIYGRFGGVYFKRGKDGQHVQAMPRRINYTRSAAQQGAFGDGSPFGMGGIKGFSGASALWLLALLGYYSSLWVAWALSNLFMTKRDGKKRITGYNWYIYYAMIFPETQRPPFWKPPHSISDLPAFVVTYRGLWTYEHAPTDWPAECPSGYYWEGIPWNGKPSYKTDDFNWHIWWTGTRWALTRAPGLEEPGLRYYSPGTDIMAYYKNPETKLYSHVYFGNHEEMKLPH